MTIQRAEDALVGRSLGEFVLRERIGQGGFGAVYRATQPALDREAVVKVLHARLHASSSATERFLREAKLASKLDHPYAAHIYAFGAEPDGELWIAMELVRGTPLDQLLAIHGTLPLERFVPLLDRICEVVHTAHEQGIVHRDLKPANVMVLSRAGRMLPKLLDFGIAKGLVDTGDVGHAITVDSTPQPDADLALTQDTAAAGLTQRGALMGSPLYMAPEQWLDAGAVDARTDAYALAILAYEAITGKPPFSGKTITALAQAHANDPPPPLHARFPPALNRVFERALAKQPEDRYPDLLAFAAAFRQASGIGGEPPSLPAIAATVLDATLATGPQPIAEALAALDAARNAHQARAGVAQLTRTITRYLGLLALACRSRVTAGSDPPAVADMMRALYRRSLADREWIELARQLTRAWIDRADAYPIPELVGAFHGTAAIATDLEHLANLPELGDDDALLRLLDEAIARLSGVLGGLAFLADYALVVTAAGGIAERWIGVRRPQRTTMPVRGKSVAAGVPAVLDKDGVPVLSLAPLVQVAAPTPGAPLDLFLFEGRDTRGAKLVALPSGFEHHDDTIWDWFRAQLIGSFDETERAAAEESTPYRGLSPFAASDGKMFFGREKLVDAFVNRLRVQPLLAVVGRSGAGKSSFIQAGVIPALPQDWRTITMRPGSSPLAALHARLEHAGIATSGGRAPLGDLLRADAATRGPLLLVVDQLEELFTLCQDDDERRAFAEALVACARTADDPVRVVCTLRDDFLVRTEQLAALRNRLAQGLQLLTVPALDDLLRIVIEPARRVGYEFDDAELPQEIVREVADQPGALALISFTASKLWELRDRHFKQLTRLAYKSLGGVGGALARHAELTLQEMVPEERVLTREAFRHLVTTQSTRAVLRRAELRQLLGGTEHADRVMEKLVAARLLVASENDVGAETIEIVHEALLVAWPRLVGWLREDSEGALFREQLRSAAQQWHDRERARGLLWRDDALADFTRWRARHTGPLTDLEGAFAAASLADAARGRRNRRLLLAAAFATLVAVVVGLVLFNARITRQREQATAAAQQLHDNLQRQYENQGRQLVLAGEPLKALAFLAKSAELGAAGPAHDFLVAQAVQGTAGELLEVHHGGRLRSAQFSHDGTKLVTASSDGTAIVWDATTSHALATLRYGGDVTTASFAPDDATVLTAGVNGLAIIWDARDGAPLRRLAQTGTIYCARYSPDGTLAVTAGAAATTLWNTATGEALMRSSAGAKDVGACAFSADGALLAVGDQSGTTRLWDVRRKALVHELHGEPHRIYTVEFSPSGTRLVVAELDPTATEWDVASGTLLQRFVHKAPVDSAAFSPDGRSIVTADDDHTATVWNAETGDVRWTLGGHTAQVRAARYSRDGRYIITAAEDGTAQLWEAETGRRVARWLGHRDAIVDVDVAPRGDRVVTAGHDGIAVVWDVRWQERVTWLAGHTSYIQSARFSADGRRVVTASSDQTVRTWDAESGRTLQVLQLHSPPTDAELSPDGTWIATAEGDGHVRLWNASDGTLRTSWSGEGSINRVSWSPDGSTIVAVDGRGTIWWWDVATGRVRREHHGDGILGVLAAAFDRTGTEIVISGVQDHVLRILDANGTPLTTLPTPGHPFSATFDPSGTRILSFGGATAAIWNRRTHLQEVELEGHNGIVVSSAWGPDGATAITASDDGTARIWDTQTGDELAELAPRGRAVVASFAPDGGRIVIGEADGTVAIHELPRYQGSSTELARLLRCRVPFVIENDRVKQRDRDRASCVGL